MSMFDQVGDVDINNFNVYAISVELNPKNKLGIRFNKNSVFIGVFYEENWYLYAVERNQVQFVPEGAKITKLRNVKDSHELYNLIVEEIKAGRIKPFSIEG